MALSVLIRSGDAEPPLKITFDAPRIVVGRGEGCDVRLPDPSVSHRHASFRQRGADYLVQDEGSTNGTFVGAVRLPPQTPRVVRSGDAIRIGRIWLEVRLEPVAPTQHSALVTREIALSLVAGALAAEGEAAAVRLRVVAGPDLGRELHLDAFDQAFVIGRGKGASLLLSDDDVSRRHVEVTRRGDRILVRDLASKNGATLGGEPLPSERAVAWPKTAVLALGNTEVVVDDPISLALTEIERATDERMSEDESIEPPPELARGSEGAAVPDAGAAPAALPETKRRPPAAATRRGWQWSDTIVSLIALGVLGASLLGLYWLLSVE